MEVLFKRFCILLWKVKKWEKYESKGKYNLRHKKTKQGQNQNQAEES